MVKQTNTVFVNPESESTTESKAELTRQRILQAGFDEIYENGFQGMRIDAVLKKTGLAKGALYHHFPNKKALGYAIVDEVIRARTQFVLDALNNTSDPIQTLCDLYQQFCDTLSVEEMVTGCPANNLVQEMSGLDDGFKERLENIYDTKISAIADALKKGQAHGVVKQDIDAYMVAGFIVSSSNGIIGAGKCTGDISIFRSLISTLCDYIQSLRV